MREMKDSGIEWIGKIPESWETRKIKYCVSCLDGKRIPLDATKRKPGRYPYWGAGKIMDYINDYIFDERLILLGEDGAPFFDPFRPVSHLLNEKAWVNNHIHVLKPNKNIYDMYLIHSLNSVDYHEYINGAILNKLTQSNMNNIVIPFPTLAKQHVIADFLNTKCADIDSLAEDIQKQIETLKEYKKSVITQAITKGLGQNVEMKRTVSPYWQRIPKNWHLSDIKYVFAIVKRIAGKEGYDVLSVTQKGLKIKDISHNEGQIAENYKGYQFVYPGDFVMNHMDLLTGWVDLSKFFGVTSPDYRVFKLRDDRINEARYYKYVMQCCYSCRIFYSLGQGVSTLGRWRLQTSAFNNFLIPVPPTTEQKKIADFLDAKCADIDAAIDGKQKQLDVLKEYKKSLIYEYVTGKKEVPCGE